MYTDEELDDLIDEWHNDPRITVPLHEWLGMTWNEYGTWVTRGIKPNPNA